MRAQDLPKFKDIPAVKGMPHSTAWGLWDKNGERDSCGSLNLLTPENTKEAQKEIKSGQSVALNWNMECAHEPGFQREKLQHTLKDLRPLGFVAFDDIIHVNTQAGSQWDGFRHWAHQESGLFYNNLTADEVLEPQSSDKNGIHQWSRRGGITARAVLIDYVAYAQKHGIKYSPMTRHEITISDLEKIAKDQGVEFKPADILIIRSGWIQWYNQASEDDRIKHVRDGHEFVGLAGNAETVEWLWDHHFSAVAGDAIAFEAWPPQAPYRLHDHLLAMWGTPIGELWNLEELAEVCKRDGKYSFFLTSAPLNINGGVASPPNALAIL